MMKYKLFLFSALICFIFITCKKNDDGSSPTDRIKAIKSSAFNHIYQYDAQNRLAGIDYGVSSRMKATYNPSGVVLQWYDGADNPTAMRMEMNVVNGLVNSVKETNDNYKMDHYYNYDGEGRMSMAQLQKTRIQNNLVENSGEVSFTWSGNLLSKVLLQVRDGSGIKTDSIIWTMNYYEDKKFIAWEDVGFSFFGKAPVGGFPNGFGWRLPVNFLSEGMIASAAAMKDNSRKSYFKHNGQWQLSSGSTQYPETQYSYDAQGRLNSNGGLEINWK